MWRRIMTYILYNFQCTNVYYWTEKLSINDCKLQKLFVFIDLAYISNVHLIDGHYDYDYIQ